MLSERLYKKIRLFLTGRGMAQIQKELDEVAQLETRLEKAKRLLDDITLFIIAMPTNGLDAIGKEKQMQLLSRIDVFLEAQDGT